MMRWRPRGRFMLVAFVSAISLLAIWNIFGWLKLENKKTIEDQAAADLGATAVSDTGSAAPVADEPEMTESEKRIEEVRVRYSTNCTGEQPTNLTDPDDYNKLGLEIMEGIARDCSSWEDFQNADTFSYAARLDYDGEALPYLIAVNRAANTVTVYTLDADGNYTVPYAAFVCSTGAATPIGWWQIPTKWDWGTLIGPVYGQYVTLIEGDILFHSVPYFTEHKDDLEYEEYNKLGTAASLGCVRLAVCDAKWIYDNCSKGTTVVIYDDAETPGPMGKPGTIQTNITDTDTTSMTYRGFDPTDPDSANPWDDKYEEGTAIRSVQAQKDWDEALAAGTYAYSITETYLQGWSTDTSTENKDSTEVDDSLEISDDFKVYKVRQVKEICLSEKLWTGSVSCKQRKKL